MDNMVRRKEQEPRHLIRTITNQIQVPPGDRNKSWGVCCPLKLPAVDLCFRYQGAKGQLGFTMQFSFLFLILEKSGSVRRGGCGFSSYTWSVFEGNDQSQTRFLAYSEYP